MFTTFGQKFGQIVRHMLPLETALAFLLFGVLVWPIPYIGSVSPMLVLVAVYYWAIYRPDLFRPVLVFLLGLLNDIVNFLPIGMSAVVFLGVYQLVFSYRRYFVGQIFSILWFGFGLISFLAIAANWICISLYNGAPLAVVPVLVQYVLTVVLFPIPARILIRLQRNFLTQENT